MSDLAWSCQQVPSAGPDGSIYFSEGGTYSIVCKTDPDGFVRKIAGTSTSGFSGDGGPALGAQLDGPAGIALQDSGAIFFADGYNNRIRKIDPDGIISTIAGTGDTGNTNDRFDWGIATGMNLKGPNDVVFDSQGNLYIADTGHYRVIKVDPQGNATRATGQDEWLGTDVVKPYLFMVAGGVSVGHDDKLFVADYRKHLVWRVDNPSAPPWLRLPWMWPRPSISWWTRRPPAI
jgi:sugar lactone lactonase YvrE